MTDLVATKAMTYATRRLLPGDPFAARTTADARALVAIGKARAPTDDADQKGEVEQLRGRYVLVFGKRPYMGWDAETLKAKLAEAHQA